MAETLLLLAKGRGGGQGGRGEWVKSVSYEKQGASKTKDFISHLCVLCTPLTCKVGRGVVDVTHRHATQTRPPSPYP